MRRMRHGRWAPLAVVLLLAIAPAAHADNSRYALVHGCYDLTSGGTSVSSIGPFRMQATALGKYLLYGKKADFLAKSGDTGVDSAGAPSDDANWTVDGTTGAFTLTLESAKQSLAYSAGKLALVPAGQGSKFGFAPAQGCAIFPESEVDVTGAP